MPGFWRRHRIVAAAFVLSAFLTVGTVAMDAVQGGYDPLGMAVNAAVFMAIGVPLTWAILTANMRLVAWWRKRHAVPSRPPAPTAGGDAPTFRWSGRPVRRPWAFLGFLVIFALTGLFTLYGQPQGTVAADLTLGLLVVVVLMVSVAAAYAFRKKSVTIDGTGVHIDRGFHSDVHVRWSEIREIGIVKFPLSEWLTPFSAREPLRMIMLRGQDGGVVGMVQPDGDVAPEASASLESAILAHAAAHSVPVHDVGYREMMTWRRPKRPTLAPSRAP